MFINFIISRSGFLKRFTWTEGSVLRSVAVVFVAGRILQRRACECCGLHCAWSRVISLVSMAAGACEQGRLHAAATIQVVWLLQTSCCPLSVTLLVISLKIFSREDWLTCIKNGFKNSLLEADLQLLKLQRFAEALQGAW